MQIKKADVANKLSKFDWQHSVCSAVYCKKSS